MAYAPVSFSNLPLILAGPILRRVEASSVSVWLALKESRTTVKLRIYNINGKEVLFSQNTSTIKLGDNLHVCVVTASTTNSSNYLHNDETYYYDIEFNAGENLGNNSVTGGTDFSYGTYIMSDFTYKLPSFALPPSSLSNLRIVHGSCRKPHGEGAVTYDALPALNTMIELAEDYALATSNSGGSYNNSVYGAAYAQTRPHQLFFTGDQIYADDVSEMLLKMISETANINFGWNETLPGNPSASFYAVGNRGNLITDTAKFTAGKQISQNHLIFLQEYYLMYLFVWSDKVWPTNFPPFSGSTTEIIYSDDGIPEYVETIDHAIYSAGVKNLSNFKDQLPLIRKALANVPTYMMFDDHDVTDDWNINKAWQEDVYGSSLGTRIIQNALTAYTIFQGWGNKPNSAEFTNTNNNSILKSINDWKGTVNSVAERLKKYFNLPSTSTETILPLDFYFNIEFPLHHVIVLDTRTHRAFPIGFINPTPEFLKHWAPELIEETNMSLQIPSSTKELTIVISPAPIVGDPSIEDGGQPLGIWAFEKLGKDGALELDYETWKANILGFQKVLLKLSQFDRVVILSGDVHYAFSAKMNYSNFRSGTVKNSFFAQLTSSGIKNNFGTNPIPRFFLDDDPNHKETVTNLWSVSYPEYKDNNNNNRIAPTFSNELPGGSKNYIAVVNTTATKPITPVTFVGWSYDINFTSDLRNPSLRGTASLAVANLPTNFPSTPPVEIIEFKKRIETDKHQYIVKNNNIGEVTFSWINTEKKVNHKIWFSPINDQSGIFPYTEHEIEL